MGELRELFSGKLIPNFKRPFDEKRSPNSKYSSLMNVARREVHEFQASKSE